MGSVPVLVNNDVDGLVLPLGKGVDISGSVRLEPSGQLANPTIMLTPVDGKRLDEQVEEDGSFRIRGLVPDVYKIGFLNLPDGAYVKSIRFDGREISHMNLDLTAGGG